MKRRLEVVLIAWEGIGGMRIFSRSTRLIAAMAGFGLLAGPAAMAAEGSQVRHQARGIHNTKLTTPHHILF